MHVWISRLLGKKAFVAQVLGRLLADTKVMGSIPGDHRNFLTKSVVLEKKR